MASEWWKFHAWNKADDHVEATPRFGGEYLVYGHGWNGYSGVKEYQPKGKGQRPMGTDGVSRIQDRVQH